MTATTTTAEVAKLAALTALTREVTAFETWEEFRLSMLGGYCPTLREEKVTRRSSDATRFYAQCVNKLAAMVRAEGFKVFDGRTAY